MDDHSLTCIEDTPCPSDLINLVVAASTDNCPGALNGELVGDTGFSQCESGTFSRVFSVKISDECGNYSICSITYSGSCEQFCTLTQGGWGNAGGKYPWADEEGIATTTEIISALMSTNGPVVIGSGGNSIEVQSAECVITLLPSAGGPKALSNGQYTASPANGCDTGPGNKNPQDNMGRIKNNLATNTIALQLNLWYSAHFGNDLANYDLATSCMDTDLSFATYGYPATVQGLLDFANAVLGGHYGTAKDSYAKSLAGLASSTISDINEYWHECLVEDPCSSTNPKDARVEEELLIQDVQFFVNHRFYPNPVSDTPGNIVFMINAPAAATLSIYNMTGQQVAVLFDSMVEGNTRYEIRFEHEELPVGVYFYQLQFKSAEERAIHHGRIVLMSK